MVEEHRAADALEELARYEEENRRPRRLRALPPAAPLARPASVALALVVSACSLAQWNQAWSRDWVARGGALAGALRTNEPWRAVTALTLHADPPHLLSNLVFGLLFSYLVFHACGGGLGLLALLASGVLGNYTNAWVQSGAHLSIGASTAVFGALGILGGSEARTRHLLEEADARRFAPVGGALLLLLYLGVGEAQPTRDVDVLAHLFGLAWGLLLGALLAGVPRALLERRRFQLACALAAGALLALSWALALA